jgi:hypothetical protein
MLTPNLDKVQLWGIVQASPRDGWPEAVMSEDCGDMVNIGDVRAAYALDLTAAVADRDEWIAESKRLANDLAEANRLLSLSTSEPGRESAVAEARDDERRLTLQSAARFALDEGERVRKHWGEFAKRHPGDEFARERHLDAHSQSDILARFADKLDAIAIQRDAAQPAPGKDPP